MVSSTHEAEDATSSLRLSDASTRFSKHLRRFQPKLSRSPWLAATSAVLPGRYSHSERRSPEFVVTRRVQRRFLQLGNERPRRSNSVKVKNFYANALSGYLLHAFIQPYEDVSLQRGGAHTCTERNGSRSLREFLQETLLTPPPDKHETMKNHIHTFS